jgi:uncharacterized protein (TIGR00661 family)
MKVLYGIQGTGNGHISRARDVIPALRKHCDLDVLISGTQSDVDLGVPITYRCRGASFYYNKKGGLDYGKTAWQNFSPSLIREVASLPVRKYDLIINDFEPVSAWAARLRGVPCIAMGHQAAFWSPQTPRPAQRDLLGEAILRHYAPADFPVGFHFEAYEPFIFTPVIRAAVREQAVRDEGYYTVYLPAFDEQSLIRILREVGGADWQVFSRYTKQRFRKGNVWVQPVSNEAFTQSMACSTGVLTGAGFETPAETLFLGKKLMTLPIKGQYEQYCNAVGLERLGVSVLHEAGPEFAGQLRAWVDHSPRIHIPFPDHMQQIADQIFSSWQQHRALIF